MPDQDRPTPNEGPLLEVDRLCVEFHTRSGIVHAVDDVSFSLDAGETLAILGESGCGKSATALALMGLLPKPAGRIVSGHVRFRGEDLVTMPPSRLRRFRGEKMAMIFQDPLSSLNPVFTVGFQIGEVLRKRRGMSRADATQEAISLMDRVQIPAARKRVHDYPFQFSGGMRQRVMIALALALGPELLIADEPTTALDVTVQAQIMALLSALCNDEGMSLILISHDLGVVVDTADRAAVMYAGKVVESGPVRSLYHEPRHPYTHGLINSIPREGLKGQKLQSIPGQPPDLRELTAECSFRARCRLAQSGCEQQPPLYEVAPARFSACHFWHEVGQ